MYVCVMGVLVGEGGGGVDGKLSLKCYAFLDICIGAHK